MVRIAAMSDLHGVLPDIQPCDIVCICGDIIPLPIQLNDEASLKWIQNEFFSWVSNIPCQKVIIIGGNHDFFMFKCGLARMQQLIQDSGLDEKLIYLENSSTTYKGLTFYGCPFVQRLPGWAFNTETPHSTYSAIQDCDILLTHQPPAVGELGRSQITLKEWSSLALRNVIFNRNIRYVFCGHVHDGSHDLIFQNNTYFKNVSIKNDDYLFNYPISYLDINETDNNNTRTPC